MKAKLELQTSKVKDQQKLQEAAIQKELANKRCEFQEAEKKHKATLDELESQRQDLVNKFTQVR